MISKNEITEIATANKLPPHVVEKDYVLGWVLAHINKYAPTSKNWIFKGGTCLKKCYFETYRFSEDLDFTILDSSHIDEAFLLQALSAISDSLYEETGIEIVNAETKIEIYTNPRGVKTGQGRIYYRGPRAPQSNRQLPRIKLDLSPDEILVEDSVIKEINHNYCDFPETEFDIRCYSYTEVFAEKTRALAERTRPRDLYDVINFYRRPESKSLGEAVRKILQKKCDFKDIQLPSLSDLQMHKDECEAGWEQQLSHQLPTLPPFDSFWSELPNFFRWLLEDILPQSQKLAAMPQIGKESATNVPGNLRSLGLDIDKLGKLDKIRFAATNHLCIKMGYRKISGEYKDYLIEPYSMKQSSKGDLLLYAIKHDSAETRSFRFDRIINLNLTHISFIPEYQIEFHPVIK